MFNSEPLSRNISRKKHDQGLTTWEKYKLRLTRHNQNLSPITHNYLSECLIGVNISNGPETAH